MGLWDKRYTGDGYAYGTVPNDFLREQAGRIPPGPVLCLGEGEGRNAVYLAERGYEVTALDQSAVGLEKAKRLAAQRGVALHTVQAEIGDFLQEPGIEPAAWSGIVSIFFHVPPSVRWRVHRAVVAGLAPGGAFILEAYTPEQLQLGTGGPPDPELLMAPESLQQELTGLDFAHFAYCRRAVHEGRYHHGVGAVVQVVGIKPDRP